MNMKSMEIVGCIPVLKEILFYLTFQSGKRIESTCAGMLDLFFDRMNLPTPDEKISIFYRWKYSIHNMFA